ncbi:hypothetical protein D1007_22473 [Hordeum vulgare]|nr:hypothetical protein D1007_22473 [Hordeum vulgare]
MAGGSSSKRSSAQQASLQGAWLGSNVNAGLIDVLRYHRLLPPASQVSVRLPGSEASPTPVAGEVVVFAEHFYRGFGLPASSFFQFFGLQPHHLAPNAILQLAAFVVLCEGFVGIEPRVDMWRSLFFFKQQSIAMEKSEKGFFYVRSTDPAQDALKMPTFAIAPPTRQNWDAKTPELHPEVAPFRAHLDILRESGLLGRDLLAAMVMFQTLQRSLPQPAPDVEGSGASEMEDEDAMGPRSDSSADTGDPQELEGTKPSGEYSRHALADWTDDDEEASFCSDAAFEGDSDEVEQVTGPLQLRGRRQSGGATAADEAGERKGKGATTSRPASKRPAPGPQAGQRADGAKRRCGAWLVREAEDADEDTASAAERVGWAAADAADRELEAESKRWWDTAAGKAAMDQPCPSRVERPTKKRLKARQDPSAHARVEEPASDAASRPVPRTDGSQPSEPVAPEQVVLETIPVSPRAEQAPDAPALDLTTPDAAPDAPGATMDAPDAAHPPPAEEVAPAGTAPEPAVEPTSGAGAIVVPQRGPVVSSARGRPGSRPMKSWRAANAARLKMPAGTVLSGVPQLVMLFDSDRTKVEQAARVVRGDMERLEARTQVQAYNKLRDKHLGADSRIAELEVRLGEAAGERDALREAGGRPNSS